MSFGVIDIRRAKSHWKNMKKDIFKCNITNPQFFLLSSMYRTMYDFGFCAMDILQAVAEDSGTYEVRATNRIGTATSSITIEVKREC